MQKIILTTEDGSSTISIPELGVTYHSKFGAIGESTHIFLDACLRYRLQQDCPTPISVLEIGFGTGLNALLTAKFAAAEAVHIDYTSLELFPIEEQEWLQINHGECLGMQELFLELHQTSWENQQVIDANFRITKQQISLIDFKTANHFDCIFFDAFAPEVQPELWTISVFKKLYGQLNPDGVLTTYSSKSIVRKALQEAGFIVEKIPGPWGKREIVRARKIQ